MRHFVNLKNLVGSTYTDLLMGYSPNNHKCMPFAAAQ